MADAVLIQPDTAFLGRVLASGGGDLKKCYQCATCSVACELSGDESPFPRKQVIEAQWGLKERLMSDPAIWLCHDCGKCTERCPRGARPGDVLGAIRSEAIRHFAFPGFLGSLVANPKALLLLFLLPALIFSAVLLWAPKPVPAAPFEFGSLFPASVLEPLFFAVSAFALLAFVIGVVRFARGSGESGGEAGAGGLPAALRDIATHRRFAQCGDPGMRLAHLFIFWGFAGLAIVGTLTGIGTLVGVLRTPLPLASALKIFANLTAAVALAGVVLLLVRRIGDRAKRAGSTYFDWFFLAALAGVVFTGIASELLRLAQTGAMYAVYFVHLVLVFSLLLYAPYSKFAHLAYRTVALARSMKSNRSS
ncbi:MAG: quinone-interacting membrane-bound oxidoreductase complex subunit QmoC [Bryobacteraceae bacterium]|jgi:quinone-modifying oxidoreductase subunit QmoC